MILTEQQFRRMMPNAGSRLDAHWPYINPALEEGDITSPKRIAAFLAQLAHESGEYRYMEEIAGGHAYEGRADLGNTAWGDGPKYKGHGPIQITGKNNHRDCGEALGLDLLNDPLQITKPEHGTRAAVWFWNSRGLSALADVDWFKTITRIINGGYTGLSDRRLYWDRNRALLGLPYVDLDKEEFVVAKFQRDHGLFADGIAGPKTLKALRAVA